MPQAPCVSDVYILFFIQGMKQRQNLSGTPEPGLKKAINRNDVEDYGHLVQEAMAKVSLKIVYYTI